MLTFAAPVNCKVSFEMSSGTWLEGVFLVMLTSSSFLFLLVLILPCFLSCLFILIFAALTYIIFPIMSAMIAALLAALTLFQLLTFLVGHGEEHCLFFWSLLFCFLFPFLLHFHVLFTLDLLFCLFFYFTGLTCSLTSSALQPFSY